MEFAETVAAGLIVAILLSLAAYYTWRQTQTLHHLKDQPELAPEDRTYYHRQAWRRLVGCLLMVVLGLMMAGSYLLGLEARAKEIGQWAQAQRDRHETPVLDAEQQNFVRLYTSVWIATLLILLTILSLAAADIWAIRRFGVRHHRLLQAERRAMLEDQISRLRRDRGGA